jgi:3-hydroxymyristoyl/3-hydroxydecanoyl-(acyl carrier protein) dehydratase
VETIPGVRLLEAGSDGQSRRFRVEIDPESPLFAGHFPGHPILPGVVHLALIAEALPAVDGARPAIAEIRAVKLRRPVRPGDALDLMVASPGDGGWSRFELRGEAGTVSGGSVRVGVADRRLSPDEVEPPAVPDLPPVEALVPHVPPARFIQRILSAAAQEIVCAAEIPRLHPFAEGGRAPAFLGIEAAAQAAAALEALNRRDHGSGPRIGYLVGIREACLRCRYVPAGAPVPVGVRWQGGAASLSIYELRFGPPGGEAVTGSISTFIAGP